MSPNEGTVCIRHIGEQRGVCVEESGSSLVGGGHGSLVFRVHGRIEHKAVAREVVLPGRSRIWHEDSSPFRVSTMADGHGFGMQWVRFIIVRLKDVEHHQPRDMLQ